MAQEVDYLPFATQADANVQNQQDFAAAGTTGLGFAGGIANSAWFNKVWRQSSMVAAAVATFISDTLNIPVYDDGNLSGLVTNFAAALNANLPRQILPANTTYYVDPVNGNDAWLGTSTQPFKTIQAAINYVYRGIDISGRTVTIQLVDGTYPGNNTLTGAPVGVTRPGQFIIQGNMTTPENVIVQGQDVPCFRAEQFAQVTLQGLFLQTISTTTPYHACISAAQGADVSYGNIVFGQCAWGHIDASQYSVIRCVSSYIIDAQANGAAFHWNINGSQLLVGEAATAAITIEAGVSFTFALASIENQSWADVSATWTGTAGTTPAHLVNGNSTLSTPGVGLPGNLATSVPPTVNTMSATSGLWRSIGTNVPPGGPALGHP